MHVKALAPGLLGLLCALAACAPRDWPDDLEQARLACNSSHPETRGNFVDLAQCLNRADERYWRPHSADADLIAGFGQTRLQLAGAADAGTLAPADFDHQLAAAQSRFEAAMAGRTP